MMGGNKKTLLTPHLSLKWRWHSLGLFTFNTEECWRAFRKRGR